MTFVRELEQNLGVSFGEIAQIAHITAGPGTGADMFQAPTCRTPSGLRHQRRSVPQPEMQLPRLGQLQLPVLFGITVAIC